MLPSQQMISQDQTSCFVDFNRPRTDIIIFSVGYVRGLTSMTYLQKSNMQSVLTLQKIGLRQCS